MTPLITLKGIAAPLRIANLDTDAILPARFLKGISRDGMRDGLFANLRTDGNFVLDTPPWNEARIIIGLENFGCGSSREHAPWALADFGIRCIIAPSFADIFHNNCFENGILPIAMPQDTIYALLARVEDPKRAYLTIDLPQQSITAIDLSLHFDIEAARKSQLIEGLDRIARSLLLEPSIAAFEDARRDECPPIAF